MHYRNMIDTKQSTNLNTTQIHWQIETSSLKLLQNDEIGYLEYMSASLLAALLKGVNRFTRWLNPDYQMVSYRNVFLETAISSPTTVKSHLRINSHGLEIIKRFECFPPDVQPDVREAEQIVRRLVKVPLTTNQFSALVSFTFNVGETTLQESALLKYLNAGRYRAAAKEFDFWVYIGSSRFSQLVARRVAERGLFLKAN